MPRIATVKLKSISPYGPSRAFQSQKKGKESHDAHDERCWRERMHVDPENGEVVISPMAIKKCLDKGTQRIGRSVPGKGKTGYFGRFVSGVMVQNAIRTGILAADVSMQKLHLNSDGVSGGGKRVWKRMPIIPEWEGVAEFIVLDDIIPEDVFEESLREGGQMVGLGQFRPEKGGYQGRFTFDTITWRTI